jgi:hypothetical protein
MVPGCVLYELLVGQTAFPCPCRRGHDDEADTELLDYDAADTELFALCAHTGRSVCAAGPDLLGRAWVWVWAWAALSAEAKAFLFPDALRTTDHRPPAPEVIKYFV